MRTFFLFFFFCQAGYINGWDYNHNRMVSDNWNGICKTGKNQSPININTKETVKKRWEKPMVFGGYNQPISVYVVNNGHTIVLVPMISFNKIYIHDGAAGRSKYHFAQAHFHWGSTNDQGSEHTINNKSAPMEIHLVHFNQGVGNNLNAALTSNEYNSIEFLVVLSKIGKKNIKLAPLFDAIKLVSEQKTNTVLKNKIKLLDLIPNNISIFYLYNGSLTTPPCKEIATWKVFKKRIEVSQEQLDEIRKAYYHIKGETLSRDISNNYRSPQPLHDRMVEEIYTPFQYQ